MPSSRDVDLELLRDLERQRLDVDLVRDLGEDAALLDADRLADERDHDGGLDRLVEADLLEVDVRDRAAHLVALVVLEDRRVRRAAVDGDVEHGVASRPASSAPRAARARRSRSRRARRGRRGRPEQPLPAQAPRLGRAESGPLGDHELDALSSHGAPV